MFIFWDFANPSRIARVQTASEVITLINVWNGITPCYLSVNSYDIVSVDEFGNEIRKAYITRAFFDFDNDSESVRKFVDYLIDKDYKFELYHSGGGHHVYVHVGGEGNGQNLRILQLSLLNDAKSKCDMHVIGDTQRVSRIPNTWNFKSNNYCISIRPEELGREDGSKQRFERFINGTRLLDLSSFTEDKFEYLKPEIVPNLHISGDILLIPCMKNIISTINPRHDQRFLLAVYLSFAIRNGKDLYYFDSKDIIRKIIEFMNMNCVHWIDFDKRKTLYYLNNIIPKFNPIVDCKFIKSRGCCINCSLDKL